MQRDPAVLVVMGVSGSGKTTIAVLLAERLRWELADADSFHSAANVRKMRSGNPLTASVIDAASVAPVAVRRVEWRIAAFGRNPAPVIVWLPSPVCLTNVTRLN